MYFCTFHHWQWCNKLSSTVFMTFRVFEGAETCSFKPPASLATKSTSTVRKCPKESMDADRCLSKDVWHRTLSECFPLYLLGYISVYMYWQASRFVALGDGQWWRETKKAYVWDTKESGGEKRTKGREEVRRWRRRDREKWENLSCTRSIIQERKRPSCSRSCFDHAYMASPANGPQIDVLADPPHTLTRPLVLSLSYRCFLVERANNCIHSAVQAWRVVYMKKRWYILNGWWVILRKLVNYLWTDDGQVFFFSGSLFGYLGKWKVT